MARRKNKGFEDYLDAQEREHVLYELACICTTIMPDNRGVVGDEARAVGGSLVAPLIDSILRTHTTILRRLEKLRGSVSIVTGGVPVNAVTTGVNLERASQYGNHRSATEHLPTV